VHSNVSAFNVDSAQCPPTSFFQSGGAVAPLARIPSSTPPAAPVSTAMAIGQPRPGAPTRHPPPSLHIAVAQPSTAAGPPRRSSRTEYVLSHRGRVDVRQSDTRDKGASAVYPAPRNGRRRAPRSQECATAGGVDVGAAALPRQRPTRRRHLPRAAATQVHAVAVLTPTSPCCGRPDACLPATAAAKRLGVPAKVDSNAASGRQGAATLIFHNPTLFVLC